MPASYHIDLSHGVVMSVAEGRLTDADMLSHQRWLRADPAFRPEFHQLIDLRRVEELAITSAGVWTSASVDLFGPGSKRGLVVADEEAFGMARMFQTLRGLGPEQVQVFRDIREARRWLGLPAE